MQIDTEILYFELLPAIRGIFLRSSFVTVNVTLNESSNTIAKTKSAFNIWKQKRSDLNSLYLDNDLKISDILKAVKSFENGLSTEQKRLPSFIFIQDTGLINVWPSTQIAGDDLEDELVYYNPKHLHQKVVVITGGAQGFGEGIAVRAFKEGAHVVVADLNEKLGSNLVRKWKGESDTGNRMMYFYADVTNEESVRNLIMKIVDNFGGIDILISNAGVLRAGGLDELKTSDFEFVNDVNYKGFFLCSKYASRVMKIQNKFNPSGYCDIIQINSKSGLEGSQKNFAYAGSKFGSIGLVQSFALELIENRIKVNAICPGNYFDGPLWSDPENGLFVQYLRAGKVKGAKNIADVKRFYESKVPMNRGVTVDDVMLAILYASDQKYETGQAIPVTGGQVMR
ncbi:MAG: SDR family NAD(P)-dependent oxidoreductase [Bacteroidales bacterium]|nr:SDR family NAD(P)-dependent oxidoreductase [Bacteroidales bacterium]